MTTRYRRSHRIAAPAVALAVAATGLVSTTHPASGASEGIDTTTPIKHLVVLFQESVPFDRYFGRYPHASNPPGEPSFVARPDTPSVNGLTEALLTANPNSANPRRLALIEDNWQLGRIGDGSFDEVAGPITNMFDFPRRHDRKLFLDRETGLPANACENP
jgi:hypothetical protein